MEKEKFDKVVELIVKQLELKNEFSKKFISQALHSIQRFDEKHTEKGLGDFAEWGAVGVAQQMDKKIDSIKNHYKGKEKSGDINKEWEDCAVYSLMGKLVENNEWYE
jgi:hypothetical protein